jgi:hypothetical protein
LIEEKRENAADAAFHYGAAKEILGRLAQRDPSSTEWEQQLAWIEERLAAASTS